MTNSLTQRNIRPAIGQAAFLPNQPIIHNCVVDPTATEAIQIGDAVAFAETDLVDLTVVKKAAASDLAIGVVVYNAIKSAFDTYERVSIFPVDSYVYLPAGAANLTLGAKVALNTDGQVIAAEGNSIGILWTQPAEVGSMVAVQIAPAEGEASAEETTEA